jgi:hypothetical protein
LIVCECCGTVAYIPRTQLNLPAAPIKISGSPLFHTAGICPLLSRDDSKPFTTQENYKTPSIHDRYQSRTHHFKTPLQCAFSTLPASNSRNSKSDRRKIQSTRSCLTHRAKQATKYRSRSFHTCVLRLEGISLVFTRSSVAERSRRRRTSTISGSTLAASTRPAARS